MANTALADMAYAHKLNEKNVGRRMTSRSFSPLAGVWRKAKPDQVKGRGLIQYYDSITRTREAALYVAEGGDLPSSGQVATQQNYVTPRLGVVAVGYTDHELQAMKGNTSSQNQMTFAGDLRTAVKNQRDRILCDLMTRDDGVKARVAATVSNSVKIYSSIPIRFKVGDKIASYGTGESSGEQRSFASVDEIGADRYVMSVTPDEKAEDADYEGSFTIHTADSLTVDAVLVIAGQVDEDGNAALEPILGWEAHFDTVNDGDWGGWDAADDATNDHVDTYAALARSSYANLNVGTIFADSAVLTTNMISRAAQKCLAQRRESSGKLVAVMNPLQYDRYAATQEGNTQLSQVFKINGTDYELPYLTVGGAARMPVITDYTVKDGTVTILPSNILRKSWAEVGWDKDGIQRVTAASGTGYASRWTHYWSYWLQSYCDMPFYACLIHGLDKGN